MVVVAGGASNRSHDSSTSTAVLTTRAIEDMSVVTLVTNYNQPNWKTKSTPMSILLT